MPTDAAYDRIADWYDGWIEGWRPVGGDLLPEGLAGLRLLDACCGQGRVARELGRRGATVVGVDLSAQLVAKAEAAEAHDPRGARYVVADVADPGAWWDGVPFDGAVCEMAFMDLADVDGALAAVAGALAPGGWLVASLVHPCFPGRDGGLASWPPESGYGAEGWWRSPDHDPDGARIRVGAHHRMLATYLNALIGAGLVIERVAEPPPHDVPSFLAVSCRRSPAAD
jgi:SAM-dependent methyltransferase